MLEKKHFHESIVIALEEADDLKTVVALGNHIVRTKIPENHLEVLTAWHAACDRTQCGINFILLVGNDIFEQQIAAVRKNKPIHVAEPKVLTSEERQEQVLAEEVNVGRDSIGQLV